MYQYMDITEVIIKIGDNYFKANCRVYDISMTNDNDYVDVPDFGCPLENSMLRTQTKTCVNLEIIGDPILTNDLNYKEEKTIYGGFAEINKMIDARREK